MNYMYSSTFARKNNNKESIGESEVSNNKKNKKQNIRTSIPRRLKLIL